MAAGNAISKQEMQAICRYAQERNVEISPLVQGLGHAGFILKHHWELRENPSSDWEFCPTNPKTYEFQFDLYRDALEAMPYGRFLHVGGDETMAIGIDERCKATDKSAFELQMGWLRKVCDFAKSNGRIPIFWDDMPLKYGGLWDMAHGDNDTDDLHWDTQKLDSVIDLFPKDCVYMRWNYRDATRPGHQRILKWYHDKGLRVMAAWLTLKEPWLILILSVVLGIIAGGNIKIIFTDSLFVCVGNDDMLINKKRSKSIAPFFIVCQLFTYSSKPIS